ncbi:hypothetical protein QAD02_000674 [Eretmocerus hayati]|uniref:Uncharacterized protein n=1 Tax=Eretmocerus hayati TaxID=131215 RepID=A0ACC2NE01_9HYME|nr:hypothetical protein QAD02_000674 [Eretmocerus hayati]
MQIVYDTNYRILAICNGRTHDQFIWLNSNFEIGCTGHLQRIQEKTFTSSVTDEGYTESRVLLIAVRNANNNTTEGEYTEAIRGTRCMVEQTIGMLKGAWRCLNNMRGLHHEPHFAAEITTACCILHKFLRERGMPVIPAALEEEEDEVVPPIINGEYERGLLVRNRIIRTHFTR